VLMHRTWHPYRSLYRFERVKVQHARFDDTKHETLEKRFFVFTLR